MASRHRFQVEGAAHTITLDELVDGRLRLAVDEGEPFLADVTTSGVPGLVSMIRNGVPSRAYVTRDGKGLRVVVEGRTFYLGPVGGAGKERGASGGLADPPGTITAPLAGVVVEIRVAVGDPITPRQTVVVIEAMKMQNEVQAPHAGVVKRVNAVQGARIEKGALVVEYDVTEAEA